jgi:hypothetical protein
MFLSVVAGQGGVKVPGAPGTLSLSAGSDPFDAIDLSWSAPSDTGGGTISGYRIKMDGSTIVADTGSTGTTYTKTGLAVGTSYNFNVAAINEKGTGADGNTPSLSTSSNMSITVTGSPTETVYAGYKSFKFTGSGAFEITANPNSATFDVLYVGAGGGNGGSAIGYYPFGDGGSGAGGVKTLTGQTGTVKSYTCTIAAGAIGGGSPADGDTTTFDGNDAGGGRGATAAGSGSSADATQGSAAGGSAYCLPGYFCLTQSGGSKTAGSDGNGGGAGYNNGSTFTGGGGGGGAGAGGGSSSAYTGGSGGAGTANTYFDGTTDYYGGGGGGGAAYNSGTTPGTGAGGSGGGGDGGVWKTGGSISTSENGAANTGGGSGGAMTNESSAGTGGSGVIIVRIPWGT